MQLFQNKDVVGGLILALTGVFVSVYAGFNYDVGRLSQFGPGMMPVALGVVLAVLGVLVILPALARSTLAPRLNLRSMVAVLSATVLFALLIDRVGLFPSAFAAAIVATLAEPSRSIGRSLLLAAVLGLIVVLIFRIGLGLQVPPFRWAF